MQLPREAARATLASVSPAARTIAILDDEPDFRRAMTRLLKSYGYDPVPFASGHALLGAVAAYRFDCILLDLSMPGLSGFDVLTALRARAHAPPVIVLTAQDHPASSRRALELEAFDCQRKPVRAPQLIEAIERACMPH